VAEATGTIITLGQWIFSESCRQAAAWSSGPLAGTRFMSINLSTIQVTYPGFVEFVTEAVQRAGVDPRRLLVEVTESANPDPESVIAALLQLHDLGIRLAVDDFGTGFASMEQLARLPFAVIKMDRSLVATVDTDARAESVVTGVTDLARRLGALTVAEGIERPEQIPPLRAMGCQMAQGFHFAPALPAEELESLVAAGSTVLRAPTAHPAPPRPAF
jgi:EAL domain-containing protein (putative c-di-GMP-specific phosphodiesterase class I)